MYTPIKLDKIRNLRFGMRAVITIEKTLKTKLHKIDFGDLGLEDAAIIIWAGLVHEDKELTVDKVIDLIDDHSDLKAALETMAEAIQVLFEKSEGTNTEQEKN